jgi:hypothetical protein
MIRSFRLVTWPKGEWSWKDWGFRRFSPGKYSHCYLSWTIAIYMSKWTLYIVY